MEYFKNLNIADIENEIWMPIPEFEYYMASSFGRIKSLSKLKIRTNHTGNFLTSEKIIKQNKEKAGYLFISMCSVDGKIYTKRVHRLIALAFHPNPDNKPQVNHKNGIKEDCRAINLEWNTKSENRKHAYKIGLQSKVGEKHHLAKMDEKSVLLIRKLSKKGIKNCELADRFDMSQQGICSIIKRRSWKHI